MEPLSTAFPPDREIHDDVPPSTSVFKRTVTITLMVLTVAMAAYMLTERSGPRDSTNLVGLVGSETVDPKPLLQTTQVTEIEDMLLSEFGYRLTVPTIIGARIVGVGTWDAGRNVRIPVVSYDDPDGDIHVALVMNYAMLDRISSAVFLDRSIRVELEHDKSYAVVSTADSREVVLWRSGDDIFLAIAENGAGSLIPRIASTGSPTQG